MFRDSGLYNRQEKEERVQVFYRFLSERLINQIYLRDRPLQFHIENQIFSSGAAETSLKLSPDLKWVFYFPLTDAVER